MTTRARLTPAQEDAIVAAYQGGDSLAQIAGRFGVTKEGVRRVLLRRGVAMRGRGWTKGVPRGPRQSSA